MSGYIGTAPVPQSTQTRETFTATAGQTTFNTGGYTAGYIDVFLNGVKLVSGTDYTATNGSDVVLLTGASAGDTLETVAYTAFTVADQDFTGTTTTQNLTVTGAFTSQGIDDNATSTAMTLDASGNLLVGTTTTLGASDLTGGETGFAARSNGLTIASRDSGTTLLVNRGTNDGDIAVFQKDGTTVGSIGNSGDNLIIGSTDVGLLFNSGANEILPATTTNTSDATKNLGKSTARFKNLYLSGGVYLGGTGAANKLDDYEEGTFTPSFSLGTAATARGSYTKIGSTVTVNITIGGPSETSSSNGVVIQGLPFATATGPDYQAHGNIMFRYINTVGHGLSAYIGDGSTNVQPYENGGSGAWYNVYYSDHQSSTNTFYRITLTYIAA